MRTNLSDAFTPAEVKAWKPKIVQRNTFQFTRDGATVIRLHHTDIVTLFASGVARYDSGGWRTMTTKDRINAYGPFKLVAVKGVWSVQNTPAFEAAVTAEVGVYPAFDSSLAYGSPEDQAADAAREAYWDACRRLAPDFLTPFADGIHLPDAFTLNAAAATADAETALRRAIDRYAGLYRASVPESSSGDCFYCAMRTQPGDGRGLDGLAKVHGNGDAAIRLGVCLGDASGDIDHLRSHIAEGYVMGSLLINAFADEGRGDPHFVARCNNPAWNVKAVKKYLRRRFGLAA